MTPQTPAPGRRRTVITPGAGLTPRRFRAGLPDWREWLTVAPHALLAIALVLAVVVIA